MVNFSTDHAGCTIIVQQTIERLKPSVKAALVLVAAALWRRQTGMTLLDDSEILDTLAVSRSQALEMRARLAEAAAQLHRPVGRPRAAGPAAADGYVNVMRAVRDHLMANPGAVTGRGRRQRYSADFQTLVVGLRAPGQPGCQLTVEQFADAVGVPLATVKDWLSQAAQVACSDQTDTGSAAPAAADPADPPPAVSPKSDDGDAPDDGLDDLLVNPHVATLVGEWRQWQGDFSSFCHHLRDHLRLPYGPTWIGSVLHALRLRTPASRGRPVMAPWSRSTFDCPLPGLQWLADGREVTIVFDGQPYIFNWEASVDGCVCASVGLTVSDHEDSAALIGTVEHGTITTGHKPVVASVDAKPSNHAPAVQQAISPTLVLQTTVGRGQAKAPVEGHFGLFSQAVPPLVVSGSTPREQARCVVELVLTAWSRGRNGRPRRSLAGRSPAQAYTQDQPDWTDPDTVDRVRAWLADQVRRHRLAQQTDRRRADPVRRQLIREALVRHGIDDPDARLERAIATYCTEAIVRAIALFDAKVAKPSETLSRMESAATACNAGPGRGPDPTAEVAGGAYGGPTRADARCWQPNAPTGNGKLDHVTDRGRYLAGIARNLDEKLELEATAARLLAVRLRHRDLTLAPLEQQAARLRNELAPEQLPEALVHCALDAHARIDAVFFTSAAARALTALPAPRRRPLLDTLVGRIARAFGVDRQRRHDLVAALTQAAVDP
jgi:hypothetical protein